MASLTRWIPDDVYRDRSWRHSTARGWTTVTAASHRAP